jgi:hypothetical protein
MICSVKPVLTEDLCVVQKEDFSITNVFIRDKPNFSSEKMLHEEYYRKGSVKKNLWSWVSRASSPAHVFICNGQRSSDIFFAATVQLAMRLAST